MIDQFTKDELKAFLSGAVMSATSADRVLAHYLLDTTKENRNDVDMVIHVLEEIKDILYYLAKLHSVADKIY